MSLKQSKPNLRVRIAQFGRVRFALNLSQKRGAALTYHL